MYRADEDRGLSHAATFEGNMESEQTDVEAIADQQEQIASLKNENDKLTVKMAGHLG